MAKKIINYFMVFMIVILLGFIISIYPSSFLNEVNVKINQVFLNSVTPNDFDFNFSHENIEDFYNLEILPNYKYDVDFDCKYWSLVWTKYLDHHNKEYKFFNTHNHIFVIYYSDDYYYILDQTLKKKVHVING